MCPFFMAWIFGDELMNAEKLHLTTDAHGWITGLPQFEPNQEAELIVLFSKKQTAEHLVYLVCFKVEFILLCYVNVSRIANALCNAVAHPKRCNFYFFSSYREAQ
ncbi:MAG: hypothetical protein PHR16_01610 [Methylovulum sp.]|nr:hypothetical protein [Methylovulum sp.]